MGLPIISEVSLVLALILTFVHRPLRLLLTQLKSDGPG